MSEEDDDEGESGMIDRQYGRRLVPGCSTVRRHESQDYATMIYRTFFASLAEAHHLRRI